MPDEISPQASQDSTPVIQADPATPMPVTPSPTVSPSSSKKKWLVLVIVLLLIGGGAAYYWKYKHPAKSASAAAKHDVTLLRVGFNNNPLNAFYPSDDSAAGVLPVSEQIFEGLVSFQNGTQIQPDLASNWSNPNPNTWIFNIKPGMYYHDGNTVTAQDVVYTWQQVNKHAAFNGYLTNTIQDVKALSPLRVEITTSQPDSILLNRLTNLWILDSKAPAGTSAWQLGTGPYTVKNGTTPTENTLDLAAFNKWHGGHIYTKEIQYTFYADPADIIKAFNEGKIDLSDGPILDASQLSSSKFNVFDRLGMQVSDITFNSTDAKSPTSNPKIRQAIAMAADKQALLKAVAQPGATIANQTIPPQIPGYDPKYKAAKTDLTQAAALVKQAGYPNGVTISFGVGAPEKQLGKELASELKPIGINIDLQVATDEGQYFNAVNSGAYNAFFINVLTTLLDGSDILGSFDGVSWYKNPDFSNQLASASGTFDAAKRLTELQKASDILLQDYEYVPVYQSVIRGASIKGLVVPVNVYDGDIQAYYNNIYHQ